MGKVLVEAKIENLYDVLYARNGRLSPSAVRTIIVTDALVDTGATGLSMPASMIAQLGLDYLRSRTARTSAGIVEARIFGPVRLTIMERECPMDVTELPDSSPVLIGPIPLHALDFVVDMPQHRLIGNPTHGGEHIIELY